MKLHSRSAFLVAALGLAAIAGAAQIDWSTVDGGGAMVTTNGAFELSATVGQHDAGGPMCGGGFELVGGFWAISGGARSTGDADGDGDVDLEDHLQFTDCMAGPGAPPSPAAPSVTAHDCLCVFDFDDDEDVDVIDWVGFIGVFAP